jgi:hypothetical protein
LAKVGRNGKYLECSTASPDIIIKHREPHHDYVLRCLNIVLRELGHRDFFLLLITMQNAASCHYIHNHFSSLKTPFFHNIPKNKSQIQPDSHSLKGSRQWCCHTIVGTSLTCISFRSSTSPVLAHRCSGGFCGCGAGLACGGCRWFYRAGG